MEPLTMERSRETFVVGVEAGDSGIIKQINDALSALAGRRAFLFQCGTTLARTALNFASWLLKAPQRPKG